MILSFCIILLRIKVIVKTLSYIGNRTLDILTWHFLSFKVVSLLIILVYGLSIHRLGEFPVILEYSRNGWWLLYTIMGVVTPLLIVELFSRIRINYGSYKNKN